MAQNITATIRDAKSGKYGVLHFATTGVAYAAFDIACGTRHANYSTEVHSEVSCYRCQKSDAYTYAKYYKG